MKHLLILLGFFYISLVHGQSNIQFSYGITPIVSSRFLTAKSESINGFQITSKNYIETRDSLDQIKLGIKLNADIHIQVNDRLEFYTGIAYLRQSIDQSKFIPTGVFIYGNESIIVYDIDKFNARFDYLSIPLGVYLTLLKRNNSKIGFDFAGTLNCLLSTTNKDLLGQTKNKTENKILSMGIQVGLFYESLINENISLHFEPIFNTALTSTLVELSSVQQNNYYFGLQIAIKHKINAR